MPERSSAPFLETVRRTFRRTRELGPLEWTLSNHPDRNEIEIRFFAPRAMTSLEIAATGEPIRIVSLEYGPRRDSTPGDFTIAETGRENGGWRTACLPVEPRLADRLTVRVDRFPDQGADLEFRVLKRHEPDLRLVGAAHVAAGREDWDGAIEHLLRYSEEYSGDNAAVCAWIAEWSAKLGRQDDAEEYAARASGHGNPEVCDQLYRTLREGRPPREAEALRDLQNEAAGWPIGPQHGIVVLERVQRHVLGLGGFGLRKVREAFEVKRPAAARMMGQLEFPFSDREERPLFTRLTVLHPDGQVEHVPLDHFSISDHEHNDIFIPLDNLRAGHWILPDLAPGDVVEWEYDLLHRDHAVDDDPVIFSLSSPFHPALPTFRARHEFVSAPGEPVRFSVRNGELESARETVGSRVVQTFSGTRFVPARQTGFRHENNWLNPLIACTSGASDWARLARSLHRMNFGAEPIEEDPPPPLDGLIEGLPPEAALEKAFYWIRDRVRYAAVRSGLTHIGAKDRGRRLVEAGVGDCKAKTYLLALVCRRLGIPYEFLYISTESGVLIEEMPASQFDHVFLRAKGAEGWLYLDAANRFGTFGAPPFPSQGISVLAAGDPPSVVEIPTEPPAVNRLEIVERFDRFRDGRAHGRFSIAAVGQVARFIDEHSKVSSLTMDDQRLAGQDMLDHYLPGMAVEEVRRGEETSGSSRFRIEGSHSRGPVTVLGNGRPAVLPLSWKAPLLIIPEWRNLRLDRLFVAPLAMSVHITLRIEGEARRAVDDVSRIPDLDNAVAGVEEEVAEEPDALEIRRKLELRRKIVRDGDLALLPQSLEHLERALRLVVMGKAGAVG